MEIVQCLLLLLVANGAPILARNLSGDRYFTRPLDGGFLLADGRPLFGPSKTIRGLLAAILITPPVAVVIGLDWETGLLIGTIAMLGDLCSSFTKRRLGIGPSGMAVGLDQIPESLFPLLAVRARFEFSWGEIAVTVAAFMILELFLSRVLYRMRIRKRPY